MLVNIIEMINVSQNIDIEWFLKTARMEFLLYFFVYIEKKDRIGFLVGLKMHL